MVDLTSVPVPPRDKIFDVARRCNESSVPRKALLSTGVYRTAEGKPYIFPSIAAAEDRILHKQSKDYLPMAGYPPLVTASREIFWGDHLPEYSAKIATLQAVGGTGGLRVLAVFLKNICKATTLLISDPAWPNYTNVFKEWDIKTFPYLKDLAFNLDTTLAALNGLAPGTVVIFQTVGHNPSGCDPLPAQWDPIFDAVVAKNLFLIFDVAYTGIVDGVDADAEPVRRFLRRGKNFAVAFSFSKNMGMYGERIGAVHFVTQSEQEAVAVSGHLQWIGRGIYSVPPQNGALIAAEVWNVPELRAQWKKELEEVSARISTTRAEFVAKLGQVSKRDWGFIARQRGMFALTGLSPAQVELLEKEGVFIPSNGRISIPALNPSNIDFVAEKVAKVAEL
jgi:aspartate/tyrosine/aromatic aminotransferase